VEFKTIFVPKSGF